MSNKKVQTSKRIITTAELASVNNRSDDSISFISGGKIKPVGENNSHEARIVATVGGKVWIQPASDGSPIDLTQTALDQRQLDWVNDIGRIQTLIKEHTNLINTHSTVRVNNTRADVNFNSDPQTQITNASILASGRSTVRVNNTRADVNFNSDPQTQITNTLNIANSKSTVRVGNARADVNFTSDPQRQINDRLTLNQITPITSGNSDQGRINLAGGLIIQWGSSGSQVITFPASFPRACLCVFFGGYRDGTNITAYVSDQTLLNISRTGFRWRRQANTPGSNTRRWFAIGN